MAPWLLALCPLLATSTSLHYQMRELSVPSSYFWAGKNGDLLRTGWSEFIVTRAVEAGPTWSWHEPATDEWNLKLHRAGFPSYEGLVRAAPLIDDGKNIYVSTVTAGNVYKFTADGEQLWKYNAGEGRQIPGIGALMGGRLYLGTDKGETIALDMETGKELWKVPIFSSSAGDTWAVAAVDGIVITAGAMESGENNRALAAVNATDGKLMWYFLTPTAPIYNVLVATKDGFGVFSDSKGTVFQLRLATGQEVWRTPTPAKASFTTGGSVIGPNGVVYSTWNAGKWVGMDWGHGTVGAFDFSTGASLWSTNVGFLANNAPVVGKLTNDRLGVVIGTGQNPDKPQVKNGIKDGQGPVPKKQQIIALDAVSGEFLWKYQLPDWHGSALGDDHRPDICLPDAFGNAAIGGDGTVYIGHASGLLYSIRDSDNDGNISASEVSTWQTGAAFQGTPAIAPGVLAVTPCDGLHVWRF